MSFLEKVEAWGKLIFDGNTRQFLSVKPPVSFSTIQLIQEIVPGKKATFFSFELNLVLKDGERLNVVDHADRAGTRSTVRGSSR